LRQAIQIGREAFLLGAWRNRMGAHDQQLNIKGCSPGWFLSLRYPLYNTVVLVWMMLGCSLLCFGLMAVGLAWPLIDPQHDSLAIEVPFVVGLGLFAALTLRSCVRFRDSIAANSDGIWYLPRKGESTFISWCDVASLKAHDTQQRLVLADATGSRSIRLEYQLEDFGRLREFVLTNTAHASPANVFHRTWINKVILLSGTVIFLVLAWLSHHQGQLGPSLFFIGFASLSLGAITQDPVGVEITREAVIVEYPGWKRTIPFDAISSITLKDVHNRGNVWAAVVIELRQGKPIRLFRFREGSVALHDTLQSAWQSAVESHESSRPK
jgi:hypothetical protein